MAYKVTLRKLHWGSGNAGFKFIDPNSIFGVLGFGCNKNSLTIIVNKKEFIDISLGTHTRRRIKFLDGKYYYGNCEALIHLSNDGGSISYHIKWIKLNRFSIKTGAACAFYPRYKIYKPITSLK